MVAITAVTPVVELRRKRKQRTRNKQPQAEQKQQGEWVDIPNGKNQNKKPSTKRQGFVFSC